MPSRAYASLLLEREATERDFDEVVSIPSRAYASLLRDALAKLEFSSDKCVNALSG